MSGTDSLKELVAYVARNLVDDPDAVEVTDVEEDQALVLELRVAQEDLGKVIGKQGRTARALRTVLSAAATKMHRRVILEILDYHHGPRAGPLRTGLAAPARAALE